MCVRMLDLLLPYALNALSDTTPVYGIMRNVPHAYIGTSVCDNSALCGHSRKNIFNCEFSIRSF